MGISEEQYARIKDSLPVQRGNVSLTNLKVLKAILYVAEQGCKWPGLPKTFGRCHMIYTRMNPRAKSGVLDRVFEQLQMVGKGPVTPSHVPKRKKRSAAGANQWWMAGSPDLEVRVYE